MVNALKLFSGRRSTNFKTVNSQHFPQKGVCNYRYVPLGHSLTTPPPFYARTPSPCPDTHTPCKFIPYHSKNGESGLKFYPCPSFYTSAHSSVVSLSIGRVRTITSERYGIVSQDLTDGCILSRRCVAYKEGHSSCFGFLFTSSWLKSLSGPNF